MLGGQGAVGGAVCLSGSELNHTSRISDLLGPEGPKYVFIELIKSDKVYLLG